MEENHPVMVAIEKAGYQIVSMVCVTEKLFDLDRDKAVDKPVLTVKMTPNKECKMFSMVD